MTAIPDTVPALTALIDAAKDAQRLTNVFYRRALMLIGIASILVVAGIAYGAVLLSEINARGQHNEAAQICQAHAENIIATDVHLLIVNNLHAANYAIPPTCKIPK